MTDTQKNTYGEWMLEPADQLRGFARKFAGEKNVAKTWIASASKEAVSLDGQVPGSDSGDGREQLQGC